MKRILSSLIFCSFLFSAQAQDTLLTQNTDLPTIINDSGTVRTSLIKPRSKNFLEVGTTWYDFLEGDGLNHFNNLRYNSLFNLLNFSYTRYIYKSSFAQVNYSYFNESIPLYFDKHRIYAEAMSRTFKQNSLSLGYSFWPLEEESLRLEVSPAFTTAYRYGWGDDIYLGSSGGEGYLAISDYDCFGFGPTLTTRFILWNHATIGVQASYLYFNENSTLRGWTLQPDNPIFQLYQPNRHMLTYQLRLGFAI